MSWSYVTPGRRNRQACSSVHIPGKLSTLFGPTTTAANTPPDQDIARNPRSARATSTAQPLTVKPYHLVLRKTGLEEDRRRPAEVGLRPIPALMVRPGQADMQTDLRTDSCSSVCRDDDELAGAGPDRSHPAVTGVPGWQGWLRSRDGVTSFDPACTCGWSPACAGRASQGRARRKSRASGAAERRTLFTGAVDRGAASTRFPTISADTRAAMTAESTAVCDQQTAEGAGRADLPGLRRRRRRCVRPRIPGFSPGGLGPHLTSSGFPRGLSSGFPFARQVPLRPPSSGFPSSGVLRFVPFGRCPVPVPLRCPSGFPSLEQSSR